MGQDPVDAPGEALRTAEGHGHGQRQRGQRHHQRRTRGPAPQHPEGEAHEQGLDTDGQCPAEPLHAPSLEALGPAVPAMGAGHADEQHEDGLDAHGPQIQARAPLPHDDAHDRADQVPPDDGPAAPQATSVGQAEEKVHDGHGQHGHGQHGQGQRLGEAGRGHDPRCRAADDAVDARRHLAVWAATMAAETAAVPPSAAAHSTSAPWRSAGTASAAMAPARAKTSTQHRPGDLCAAAGVTGDDRCRRGTRHRHHEEHGGSDR